MNFGANGNVPEAESGTEAGAIADVVVLFVVALVLLVVMGAAMGPAGMGVSSGRKWGALCGIGLPEVVGLEAAAWRWFGRSPQELSWAESATLAVLHSVDKSRSIAGPSPSRAQPRSSR